LVQDISETDYKLELASFRWPASALHQHLTTIVG